MERLTGGDLPREIKPLGIVFCASVEDEVPDSLKVPRGWGKRTAQGQEAHEHGRRDENRPELPSPGRPPGHSLAPADNREQ